MYLQSVTKRYGQKCNFYFFNPHSINVSVTKLCCACLVFINIDTGGKGEVNLSESMLVIRLWPLILSLIVEVGQFLIPNIIMHLLTRLNFFCKKYEGIPTHTRSSFFLVGRFFGCFTYKFKCNCLPFEQHLTLRISKSTCE